MTELKTDSNNILRWLSLAIWVWGGVLALGSYFMYSIQDVKIYNWHRPAVVLGCVALFQIFLSLMLRSRRRHLAHRDSLKNGDA